MKIHRKNANGQMDRYQGIFHHAMSAGAYVRVNHVMYLSICPFVKK